MFAYVGSFTNPARNGRGNGINVYRVTDSGPWQHLQHVPALENPSFLRIGPDGRTLYTVHGSGTRMSAYAIDPGTGHATLIDTAASGGENPVDFGFDPSWDNMVVANYGSGTVAVLKRAEGGALHERGGGRVVGDGHSVVHHHNLQRRGAETGEVTLDDVTCVHRLARGVLPARAGEGALHLGREDAEDDEDHEP